MRGRFFFVHFSAGLLLAAAPAWGANQSVSATSSNEFLPKQVTVAPGDTVTWTNAGGFHNVLFEDGLFTQPPGPSFDFWTVARTFDTAGTFPYYCVVHGGPGGFLMAGSVVVSEPGGGGPPGGGAPPDGSTTSPGSSSGGSSTPAAAVPVSTQGAVQQKTPPCASNRRFRIRVRQPDGARIASARVSVNGKAVEVSKRAISGKLRHTAEVDLRGLPKGTYEVDIVAVTVGGKRLTGSRRYQVCAPPGGPHALPRL